MLWSSSSRPRSSSAHARWCDQSRCDVFVEPAVQRVQGVAPIPVDGRIVAAPGQVGIECPEGSGQAEAVLGHRLGEVAARR